MIKGGWRTALIGLVLWPLAAQAEPITLKLAFFTSDQSISYRAAVQPFVDAVNAEGGGLVKIETYFSGALGKDIAQQPTLLRDGTADIAYVVPGYTRQQFPDNAVVEMAGMYRDMREATLTLTRLIAANALRGYDDFFVIGGYVSVQETFHSRHPLSSLAEIQGKKIRVNNPSESELLTALGATPVLLPINQITIAIGNGTIDAALVPPSPLADYGIKRVVGHHYLLPTSGAPLMLMMNRKKFESLPPTAQALIRKYSGEWAARKFIDLYEVADKQVLDDLVNDPRRTVTLPSPADSKVAQRVFDSLAARWAAENPHQAELLTAARAELTKIRATQ
jgi:TRAP-type C4-dicarboxylate transport system substrate-binding protein